jgi:glycosyltransferase involved in cell wall biosynthesis
MRLPVDETQLGRFYQEFATSLLEEIRTAVRVTFVGGGTAALTQALQALAGALNVSTQVMLVGAQAPERVVQYMQQADVLVNPIVIGEEWMWQLSLQLARLSLHVKLTCHAELIVRNFFVHCI